MATAHGVFHRSLLSWSQPLTTYLSTISGNPQLPTSASCHTLQVEWRRARSSPVVRITIPGIGTIQLFNSELKAPPHFRLWFFCPYEKSALRYFLYATFHTLLSIRYFPYATLTPLP